MIKEKPSHKFFERYVDNDLTQLSTYLLKLEKDLFDGVYPKVSKEFANNIGGVHNLGTKFNIFQCYNPQIHKLFSTLRDLTIEACEYYNIDYKKQSYMVQGWFNTDGIAEPPVNESTHYHDHLGGTGVPNFHGYYCVDAEPSFTYYKIGGHENDSIQNINKNNRAILSETGHPHGIGPWPFNKPRITIAYDISPVTHMSGSESQHWVPLP
jgi:hypothetical protein